MNEAAVRGEVFRLLRRLWLWPFSQTDLFVCQMCGTKNHPPKGRADIITNRHVAVEVKMFNPDKYGNVEHSRLTPSQITPEQRVWLTNFDADATNRDRYTNEPTDEGAYIALGTQGTAGRDRYLFIVPWFKYLELETTIGEVVGNGKGLPLHIYDGMHNKDQYDLEELYATLALDSYAATWYNEKGKKGYWILPYKHPLMQMMHERRGSFELRDLTEESERWPASQKRR